MPKKRAPKSAGSSEGEKAGLDTVAKMGITEGGGERNVGGRPSGYTEDIADLICERIVTSKDSLSTICGIEGMPSVSMVFRWLREQSEFREQYARAKQEQAETLIEEIIGIADDGRNDVIVKEDGTEITNSEVIQRSKLRVDTRKWLASKLLPKKYGDKLEMDVAHSGQIDSKVTLSEAKRNELMERRRAALSAGAN